MWFVSTFFNKNQSKWSKIEITNLELHFVRLYLTSHTGYQWNQKDTGNCNSHPDTHHFHTPKWHKNLREFSSIKYSILDVCLITCLFCFVKLRLYLPAQLYSLLITDLSLWLSALSSPLLNPDKLSLPGPVLASTLAIGCIVSPAPFEKA